MANPYLDSYVSATPDKYVASSSNPNLNAYSKNQDFTNSLQGKSAPELGRLLNQARKSGNKQRIAQLKAAIANAPVPTFTPNLNIAEKAASGIAAVAAVPVQIGQGIVGAAVRLGKTIGETSGINIATKASNDTRARQNELDARLLAKIKVTKDPTERARLIKAYSLGNVQTNFQTADLSTKQMLADVANIGLTVLTAGELPPELKGILGELKAGSKLAKIAPLVSNVSIGMGYGAIEAVRQGADWNTPEGKQKILQYAKDGGLTGGALYAGGKVGGAALGKLIKKLPIASKSQIVETLTNEAKAGDNVSWLSSIRKEVVPNAEPIKIVKPKVSKAISNIPKELQPLAKEAKTYKSAAEFVNAKTEGQLKVNPTLYKTAQESASAEEFIAKMSKGKPETVDTKTLTDYYNMANLSKPQLTDIYNKATQIKPTISKVPREQLPVGEGAVKTSRLEQRVRETLGSLTEEQKAGLSTYHEMNKADQISKAVKYVSENQQEAMNVLKGRIEPPKGLLKNSIAIAMEQTAKESGDAALAIKLASLRSTRAGQEISILTELDPQNPVRYLSDLMSRKIEAWGGRKALQDITQAEVGKLKQQITRAVPSTNELSAFIESIRC